MGKRASEGEKTVEHFEFRFGKTCIYTLFTEKEEGGKKREERKGEQVRVKSDILSTLCFRLATYLT